MSGAAISARYLRVNARHSPGDAADRACATSSFLAAFKRPEHEAALRLLGDDFMEWVLNFEEDAQLIGAVNEVLLVELAGFRFISDGFSDITSENEVELLEGAIGDKRFPGVQGHLGAALRLLSNREDPDYRNSIKESISAIESMAKVVTGQPRATLGEALAILGKGKRLHPALKAGFSNLYGYTSDEGGIRHAMLEEPKLTAADAKFFLLSATSFINYLKALL